MTHKTTNNHAPLFAGSLRYDYDRVVEVIRTSINGLPYTSSGNSDKFIGSVHSVARTEQILEEKAKRRIDVGLHPDIAKFLKMNFVTKEDAQEFPTIIILASSSDKNPLPVMAVALEDINEVEDVIADRIKHYEEWYEEEFGVDKNDIPPYVWCFLTELSTSIMH